MVSSYGALLPTVGQRWNTPSDDPLVKVALQLVEDGVQDGIEVLLFVHPASRPVMWYSF